MSYIPDSGQGSGGTPYNGQYPQSVPGTVPQNQYPPQQQQYQGGGGAPSPHPQANHGGSPYGVPYSQPTHGTVPQYPVPQQPQYQGGPGAPFPQANYGNYPYNGQYPQSAPSTVPLNQYPVPQQPQYQGGAPSPLPHPNQQFVQQPTAPYNPHPPNVYQGQAYGQQGPPNGYYPPYVYPSPYGYNGQPNGYPPQPGYPQSQHPQQPMYGQGPLPPSAPPSGHYAQPMQHMQHGTAAGYGGEDMRGSPSPHPPLHHPQPEYGRVPSHKDAPQMSSHYEQSLPRDDQRGYRQEQRSERGRDGRRSEYGDEQQRYRSQHEESSRGRRREERDYDSHSSSQRVPRDPHSDVPSSSRRVSTRSRSPDYWAMADRYEWGTKEWLRMMVVSVINSFSTVLEEDIDAKMVTVAYLSEIFRSYDEGRKSYKGDACHTPIKVLGMQGQMRWLNFLREMRDDGLLKMYRLNIINKEEYAIYGPHDKIRSKFVDERPYTK